MDENNKKIMQTWQKEGPEAATKQMFQHPTEKDEKGNPKPLTYAEMRALYG